jgi:TP901 family phage tail tape measure protein
MTSIGTKFTAGVTAPVLGLAGAAIKTAADFESGMSEVKAISNATGSDMKKLTGIALEMGIKTKFSAKESAEALKYMAMAGWKTKDMMTALPGVLNLAAASGEELGMVSDIVTDALTAFGMKASEAGKFADLLASASSNSNTNVGLMGETFKYVAPVAGALGYSAENTALAIGLMANAGIKASQAGTALRGGLTRLVKPPKAAAAVMDKLKISITKTDGSMKTFAEVMVDLRGKFKNLTKAQKTSYAASLFGKEAMSGWLAIINASDTDFAKLTKATNDYNGAAERMATTMLDNLNGAITILKSSIEGLMIQIGNVLMPTIKKLAGFVQTLATKFAGANAKTKKFVIIGALIAAAIGPAILLISGLIGSIGTIAGAIATIGAPVAIAIAAIVALSAVILKAKFGSFTNAFKTIAKGVIEFGKNVKLGIQFFVDGFKNAGDPKALTGNFAKIYAAGSKIKDLVTLVTPYIAKFKNMLASSFSKIDFSSIMPALKNLGESFKNLLPVIKPIIKIIAIDFISKIVLVAAILPGIIQSIINTVSNLIEIGNIIRNVVALVVALFKGDFKSVGKIFGDIWESLNNIAKNSFDGILSIVGGFINNIVGLFTGNFDTVPQTFESLKNSIANIFSAIGNAFVSFGTWISTTWTNMWNGIKNFFIAIKDGIVSIWNGFKSGVIAIVTSIATTVVGWFTWLYNHNYYFQMLVDFVKQKFTEAKIFISTVWTAISTIISTVWTKIKTTVLSAVSTVYSYISTKFTYAKNTVVVIFSAIKAYISNIWNKIKTEVSAKLSSIVGVFTSKFGDGENAIIGVFNRIKDKITGLAKEAFSWGAAIIGNISKGITSKLGEVKGSATGAAKKIWEVLGFHSPTKKGPGSDADKWAPNLIKMYAKGISKSSSLVKNACIKIAKTLDNTMAKSTIKTMLFDVKNLDKEGIKEYFKQLGDQIKNYMQDISNRTKSYMDSFDLFAKVQKQLPAGGSNLLNNLKSQVSALSEWKKQLSVFGKKVGSGMLFEKIAGLGPESLSELKSLNSMTTAQLKEYQSLYTKKYNISNELAKSDYDREQLNSRKINDIIFNITGNTIAENNIDKIVEQISKKLKLAGIY